MRQILDDDRRLDVNDFLPGLLLEDESAHEVGRQQVRGELDGGEVQVETRPKCLHRERLGETRGRPRAAGGRQSSATIMRSTKQPLADDHLADLVDRRLHQDNLFAHGLVQLRDVDLGSYHRGSSLLWRA